VNRGGCYDGLNAAMAASSVGSDSKTPENISSNMEAMYSGAQASLTSPPAAETCRCA
jgi:hypothetical protein